MLRRSELPEVDLPNAAEIDAALEAALSAPLDELLSLEEFVVKIDSQRPAVPLDTEQDPPAAETVVADTLPFPEPEEGVRRAA